MHTRFLGSANCMAGHELLGGCVICSTSELCSRNKAIKITPKIRYRAIVTKCSVLAKVKIVGSKVKLKKEKSLDKEFVDLKVKRKVNKKKKTTKENFEQDKEDCEFKYENVFD